MKTKLVAALLSVSILFSTIPSIYAGGDVTASVTPQVVEISAKSGILIDSYSGKILIEKNSHEKLPLASVTKIMTLLITMEHLKNGSIILQDTVTTSTHASQMGGSQIWLKEGEQMSVHDLLKATAVASANDAAMALAEHIAGSEEAFVAMMNARAAELSMSDTVFLNPTGLDEAGHLSSAHDIAVMTAELLKYELVVNYTSIWMDSLRDGKTELVNTNKLVRFYKGCTGMKTGTTNGAGSCISATASRGDLHLISVVMGCATSKDRFDDAKRLLDYGFSSFVAYKPTTVINGTVKVIKGVSPEVMTEAHIDERLLIPAGKQKLVKETVTIAESVDAPVTKGQKIGEVVISIEDNTIASYDITASNDVSVITFSNALGKLLQKVVQM